jgi:hypothetical protein
VFDALGGSDQRGVESSASLMLLDELVTLGEQAFHSLALVSRTLFAELREDRVQSFDMGPCGDLVLLKGAAQFRVGHGFRHLGQRLQDLLLRAV